jgi:ribulose-5-phosphate 4-epimerase/fuculose-1-phosphate aldolase
MNNAASTADERQLRIDLAAAFRIVAKLGMHEAVANHFSAAVSADGRKFLMNPKWRHFSRIKASDLVLFDLDAEEDIASRPDVDRTAWSIHGQMHKLLPQARVVIHLHPPFTTTIATLADPEIKPIDQNTARYFNRVAVDGSYGGMADSEQEGARLARLLGNKSRLLMGNHGVLIMANTVGEAFDDIYTIERACQVLVQAYSTGQPLNVLPNDVAERTAQDWEQIIDFSKAHFEEMKCILDAEDPSYAH